MCVRFAVSGLVRQLHDVAIVAATISDLTRVDRRLDLIFRLVKSKPASGRPVCRHAWKSSERSRLQLAGARSVSLRPHKSAPFADFSPQMERLPAVGLGVV